MWTWPKTVVPNPSPGELPTLHVFDVSLIWHTHLRSWCLYHWADELCLIRETSKMCSVGGSPGPGLGTNDLRAGLDTLQLATEHVSGAERWEFPLPAHVGVRSPRSTAQSRSRPLRSIPLPAHLQFHPAPVKSLHARSNLKFLCMPNTCRFQPYAWDTLSAWRTWSGFVAWLLRKKICFTSIVAEPRLRCGWTAHLICAYSAGNVAALIC